MDEGIKCTPDNLSIVHRNGDNYELRLEIDTTHYLHCILSLDNCRTVRNDMLGMFIDNGLIIEDGKYYRVEFLFTTMAVDTIIGECDLRFHSEKVNLATAVYIYDRLIDQ